MSCRHSTIYRYFVEEYFFSFFVSFLFFFFIFFLNNMILMAEEILSKNVPLKQVAKLILYSLPAIINFSLPFAALVGALMAVGRFSSDNEFLALRTAGITLPRLFAPILLCGVVITGATFFIGNYFIPLGTIKFTQLYREILFSNPSLELEPYSVKYYRDSLLITGNISGRSFDEILIIDKDSEKNRRIIMGQRAELVKGDVQGGVISLHLDSVLSHTVPQKVRGEFDYIMSNKMVYNILLKDIALSIRNPGPREMSAQDVYAMILEKRDTLEERKAAHREELRKLEHRFLSRYREAIERGMTIRQEDKEELKALMEEVEKLRMKSVQDRVLQSYELEFQKKLALPIACFTFVFLAFPVGLFTRKSGRTVGFGIGVLISILYYGMLFAGQTLGYRVLLNPIIAMWTPNMIIFLAGMIVFMGRLRR